MADSRNIGAFLMETWQGLVGLEEAVEGLGGTDAGLAREALFGLTHRLERSSAERGFPGVSRLGAGLAELVRQMPSEPGPSFDDAYQLLQEALTVLPMVLETVATGGDEGIPQLGGLQWRVDAEVAASEERAAARARAGVAGPIDLDLQSFREHDQEMLSFFAPEARDHLEGMERQLARLRSTTGDPDVLNTLFRHVHTLKGAAFTVGCEPIGRLSHCVEDLLVPLRDRDGRPSREALAASTAAAGLMSEMVARLEGRSGPSIQSRYDDLLALFEELLGRSRENLPGSPGSGSPVSVRPSSEDGPRSMGWDDEGETVELEPFDDHPPLMPASTFVEGFESGDVDEITTTIDALEETGITETVASEVGAGSPSSLSRSLQGSLRSDLGRLGRLTRGLGRLDRSHHRLDRLLDELESGLAGDGPGVGEEGSRSLLASARAESQRLSELRQQLANDLRQAHEVPVSQLFGRFSRLVRSVAADAGKSVALVTEGGEIEVDHRVLERLAEPLTHLVNNAIHHGLEKAAERRSSDKPERGTVRLAARRDGRSLHLEISDDGRGIDVDALRRKAREQGRAAVDDARLAEDRAALALIFLPGLTTAERVTTAAGRGVGMDAVLHAVRRSHGRIDIESEPGKGTCFRIEVPTSADWIEVARIRVGEQTMAVPTSAIDRLHADSADSDSTGPRPSAVHLARVLGSNGAGGGGSEEALIRLKPPPLDLEILADAPAADILRVDAVLGIEEVRLEPLGALLEPFELYRGALVDRGGRILPVIDPWRAARLAPPMVSSSAIPPSARGSAGHDIAPGVEELPVLLVDDSPSVRRVLGRTLERAGRRVVTVADGAEALDWLVEHRPSALVTDLEMPEVSGRELIERVRRLPGGDALPIAVITTRVSERQKRMAEEAGVGIFLPKPVDTEALDRWLSQSEGWLSGSEGPAKEGTEPVP